MLELYFHWPKHIILACIYRRPCLAGCHERMIMVIWNCWLFLFLSFLFSGFWYVSVLTPSKVDSTKLNKSNDFKYCWQQVCVFKNVSHKCKSVFTFSYLVIVLDYFLMMKCVRVALWVNGIHVCAYILYSTCFKKHWGYKSLNALMSGLTTLYWITTWGTFL